MLLFSVQQSLLTRFALSFLWQDLKSWWSQSSLSLALWSCSCWLRSWCWGTHSLSGCAPHSERDGGGRERFNGYCWWCMFTKRSLDRCKINNSNLSILSGKTITKLWHFECWNVYCYKFSVLLHFLPTYVFQGTDTQEKLAYLGIWYILWWFKNLCFCLSRLSI